MRILFAWELGGNYGHIAIILLIARQLRQQGHEILLTVKSLPQVEQLLKQDDFCYVTSPRPSSYQTRSHTPLSYADILIGAGFDSHEKIAELVTEWQGIFDNFQPDVVVVQYAPVAQVAARLTGLKCLTISTGFEFPPFEVPYPCFSPYHRVTAEQLLAKESEILNYINGIFSSRALSFSCLQEVFQSDLDLLLTLPEMDHYRRRYGRFVGPLSMLEDGEIIGWHGYVSPRIFVYLRPFRGIEQLFAILKNRAAEVIACIPGASDRFLAQFASRTIHISTSKMRLSKLLPTMDLAITHAGHGITGALLLAGVPMLMIPTTIEQWLLSRNMTKLGIGIGITRARLAGFSVVLARILDDPLYRERARGLAQKYATYDQSKVIQRLANTIERLPEWAGDQMEKNAREENQPESSIL